MALAHPPAQLVPGTPIGEATLAGIGVVSPQKAWTTLGLIASVLFTVGALVVWLSVDPRGPAPERSPVLIGEAIPADDDDPVELPEELPLGAELERLVAEAIPSPRRGESAASAVSERTDEEPVSPSRMDPPRQDATGAVATMRVTPTAMSAVMDEVPAPWTDTPTRPATDDSEPSSANPTVASPYTATTYGPAARTLVGRRYVDDVQRCFDTADTRRPGFSGTVLMSYMLMPDGRVASSRVARNSTGDDELGACLASTSRSWELPPPPPRTLEFSMSFAR